MPAGHVLFELGSLGREFYIILQGECAFYQKNPESARDSVKEKMKELEFVPLEAIPEKERKKSSYAGVPKPSKLMRSKVEKRGGQYYVQHMGLLMNSVNHMKAGECLGELALISDSENEPRMATVLCTEDCEFAVLDRQSFKVSYFH